MTTTEEGQIDFRDYFSTIFKRRWTVISLFTAVFLTAVIYALTSIPVYRATSRIVIEKENPNLVSIQEVMAVDATGTDYYQTQYMIIESRAVARTVIDRLKLDKSPEFFPEPKDDVISNVKNWVADAMIFWKDAAASLLRSGDDGKAGGKDQEFESADSALVSTFINRILVKPVRGSRLVDVSVDAADPLLAARMSNELVRAYIDLNLETKLQAAKDAVKWLRDRIEEERKKVEEAENALLRYKEHHEIITDFSDDAENITAQKLASLNQEVVQAEAHRVEAETRYRQAVELESTPDMLDSIPEVLTNDLIKEIKKMEVDLYNRMSELSKKYGRQHPRMQAIQSELIDLQERKNREIKRVINSLRNEYRLATAREESLKGALSRQKTESLDMNKKAIQFRVLQRQAESSRDMYELLVKRFKETSLTEEMKTGNIRVVDQAEVPENPVKPNKKLIILLAAVLGLAFGVGAAFFLDYMDNTIKLPSEIKDRLGIAFLGPVPAVSASEPSNGVHPDLITVHSTKSTVSEAFRGIRTNILFSSVDITPQVILVTSAGPEEGKTICAVNLAVAMAQSGAKVVLVDCDMRRPRVHKIFSKDHETGLSSVLAGSMGLAEAVAHTDIVDLDVITSGPIPPNPSEILGSRKMGALLDALREKYDRIVLDTPPTTAVTDAVVLAKVADGVVVVIRAGETPRQVVQNGIEQLRAVGANILGALLNGVDMGRDSYYYYQYYYYYYGEDGHKKKKEGDKKRRAASS